MGFREKVIARLEELGMSRQELAVRAEVSKSYIYKLLLDGPGNRENPSVDKKQKIASALGLTLGDLDDIQDLTSYLITALYELPVGQRRKLAAGTPNDRLSFISSVMKQDGRWPDDRAVSRTLGLPGETYDQLMEGSPMDHAAISTVSERTGLSVRFWLRGRVDPNPRLVNLLLESDQVAEILEIAEQIISKKVTVEVVHDIVEAVAKGGA